MSTLQYPSIQFMNHASVLLHDGQVGLLTDPWFFGPAFDFGWSLLYENSDTEITECLEKTNFIWYSHEHPDHFSVAFVKKYEGLIKKRGIKFIFQYTKDKRVVSFLKKFGFEVIEIENERELVLSDKFKIKVQRVDFFDSALIANINGQILFHINDCPISNEAAANDFIKKHGTCDILLTQFSYAAWRGGKNNLAWRKQGAKAKLDFMRLQCRMFRPKVMIPFASFVYFSNDLNYYMNDSVNTPDTVMAMHEVFDAPMVFMKPSEVQRLDQLQQNPESLNFWRTHYESLSAKARTNYAKSHDVTDLEKGFQKFRDRVFSKNSKFFIWLFQKLPFLGAFQPLTIHLVDLNQTFRCDIFEGLKKTDSKHFDVSLHSHSLMNVFENEFGLDALAVNSCFETDGMHGFSKFVKHFGINNLNGMGYSFDWTIIFQWDLYVLFFQYLRVARSQRT